MTNGEKFKSAKERAEAFKAFCKEHEWGRCQNCPATGYDYGCSFVWLDLEAEEEKPLPCPFCGQRTEVVLNAYSTEQYVRCAYCGYFSSGHETSSAAIATHNRVARAVKEANDANS